MARYKSCRLQLYLSTYNCIIFIIDACSHIIQIFLQPNAEDLEFNDDSLFPRHIGIKEATLLLVKEKLGRYSLLRVSYFHDFKLDVRN